MTRCISNALAGAAALLAAACSDTTPEPSTDTAPEPSAQTASALEAPRATLHVSVFPGASNWPVWIAQEKGFFACRDISVEVTPTPSSVEQLTGLIQGQIDIAITAIDNLVAYREGQGQAPIMGPDLVAIMGVDNGYLSVVALPQIASYADLRGKSVSVDAAGTGFAFVLYELLSRAGLQRNTDYSIVSVGGTQSRYQALLRGDQSATLLTPPFDIEALADGDHRLGTAVDVLGPYQGLVAGVRQPWAKANREPVVAYVAASIQAMRWLFDPKNKAEALTIFSKNQPDLDAETAQSVYRAFFGSGSGLARSGEVDMTGTREVLALRSKYAVPPKALTDPTKYYDSSFREAAQGH